MINNRAIISVAASLLRVWLFSEGFALGWRQFGGCSAFGAAAGGFTPAERRRLVNLFGGASLRRGDGGDHGGGGRIDGAGDRIATAHSVSQWPGCGRCSMPHIQRAACGRSCRRRYPTDTGPCGGERVQFVSGQGGDRQLGQIGGENSQIARLCGARVLGFLFVVSLEDRSGGGAVGDGQVVMPGRSLCRCRSVPLSSARLRCGWL